MKKTIDNRTIHSSCFKKCLPDLLKENSIQAKDVIGITSQGDFTTLWYWSKKANNE